MTIQIPRIKVDRWTLVDLAGAGLLGAGVWTQWGSAWAYMLWGVLLLGMSLLRGVMMIARSARQTGELER